MKELFFLSFLFFTFRAFIFLLFNQYFKRLGDVWFESGNNGL
jgi:hypothetical protein